MKKTFKILFIILLFPIMLPWVIISAIIQASNKLKEGSGEEKEFENPKRERLTNERIPIDSKRSIYMMLETFYIIETSSNVETVIGRLKFLFDILADVESSSKYNFWIDEVREVTEKYELNYYNKILSDEIKGYVINPSMVLNNWDSYHDKKLFDCVHRYAKSQDEHIKELKTQKAKENRTISVIEKIDKIALLVENESTKEMLILLKNNILSKIKRTS